MRKKTLLSLMLGAAFAFGQEDYTTWTSMRQITVNTTASGGGAGVSSGVANFPVLVRLTSAQSNVFTEASANGADIRFTADDGVTRLKHQRERWNSSGQLAEFWVLVPSVAGNANTVFRMYWGKSGAADSSSGADVFQTTNGFQAVWHMNAGGTGNESDATQNNFTLTAPTASPTNNANGAVGTARSFASSSSQYLVALNTANSALSFPYGGPFTLSAWINPTTNAQRVILGKSDFQYMLQTNSGSNYEACDVESGWDCAASTSPATGQWSHFVFSRSPGGGAIYVDGVEAALWAVGSSTTRNTNYNVFVGALVSGTAPGTTTSGTKGRYWNGGIDEVRMSSTARSADWIKLCFETQKPGATSVTVGSTLPALPAPSGLAYAPATAIYTVGYAIPSNTPTVVSRVTSWSIAPALPSGLSLDNATGAITGTPTAASAAANYTVTATNATGSTTALVNITVNASLQAPTAVTYSSNPAIYGVGVAIAPNNPIVTGTATGFSVSPALPAGLALNTTSGVISGTPTAASAASNYVITASNSAGSTTGNLNIRVLAPPSGLAYSTPTANYARGAAIPNNTPTVTGTATRYSVTPALPSGLSLDTATGVISGTPTAVQAAASYTVTAGNVAGSTTAVVSIAVYGPPTDLAYANVVLNYTVGQAITPETPTVTGVVTRYSINPALPAGLVLDTLTGALSGTPTAGSPGFTEYTVTAANGAGNSATLIYITVATSIRDASAPMFTLRVGSTAVSFRIPEGAAGIRLSVRDLRGRPVWTQEAIAGTRELSWNGAAANGWSMPSGAYLVRAEFTTPRGTQVSEKRMTLAR